MSARASGSLPSSCSGAMYWKVPTMLPSAVSGFSPVARFAQLRSGRHWRVRGSQLGQPEVEQLGPRPGEHDVSGLQVAVDDPVTMGHVERTSDLDAVAQDLLEGKCALPEPVRKRLAFEVLHDQVIDALVLTDVVEDADVGMCQGGYGLGLPLEALASLGARREVCREDLDGDGPVEAGVASPVHLAHATRPQGRRDLVGTEADTRA